MNELISLGYGWHDCEESWRWSGDMFNINIIQSTITQLIISFFYNKTSETDTTLIYSSTNWKTCNSFSLVNGENTLKIEIDNPCSLDFKCHGFIPIETSQSIDRRLLGIQLKKIVVNDITELYPKDIKLRSQITTPFHINDIDKCIKLLSINGGWHELEEDHPYSFRWTTGDGEININTEEYSFLKLKINSPKDQNLKIIFNGIIKEIMFIYMGWNYISIPIKNVNKVNIISDSFCPLEDGINCNDIRKLGIRLYEVLLINENIVLDIPLKNLFFDHDVNLLASFVKKYNFDNKIIHSIGNFGEIIINNFDDIPSGKLNINEQVLFTCHRSGWNLVVKSLTNHHNKNGVKFIGFLEKPFVWDEKKLIHEKMLPFTTPWTGFIHNPWEFPKTESVTTKELMKSDTFINSLSYCKGIFVLSNNLKLLIENEISVPVNSLYLPTEFVTNNFSMEKFVENKEKRILEMGSWLRKANSFFMLKTNPFVWKKVRTIPSVLNFQKLKNRIKHEQTLYGLTVTEDDIKSVEYLTPMSDDVYDEFLTKNIVFLDLHASSANNVIVECIARNTPLLVNPLPEVIEYLGEEYPYYFNNMEEANEKINDFKLIEKTHIYLTNWKVRNYIKGEYFIKSFLESSIYKSI